MGNGSDLVLSFASAGQIYKVGPMLDSAGETPVGGASAGLV